MWRKWDEYCGLADNPDEPDVPDAADGVDFDALCEEDLLWGHVVESDDSTEQALDATQSSATTVSHHVPIS